jgi:hypothetical protein
MPQVEDEIFAIEEGFWAGDAEYYRRNLADTCLVAFPGMAGAFDKEAIAATVKDGQGWRELSIERKGSLAAGAGGVLITYEARAARKDGEAYAALVSSGYAREGQAWKMIFHQQTPLEPGTK